MHYLELGLFVAGTIMLVVGYRKNHRNLLLAAAIALFLSDYVSPITLGFIRGLEEGPSSSQLDIAK
jgi:hypothetical protein